MALPRRKRWSIALLLGALSPARALAGADDALVEPTRASDATASAEKDPELHVLMQRVDALLQEAVQDLGLTLDLERHPEPPQSDQALVERAADSWVISGELARKRQDFELRLVLVPPGSRVLYVRTQTLAPEELDMRVALMARDLVEAGRGRGVSRDTPPLPAAAEPVAPAHSPGRAILALNAALLGGYAGYSLQQASGSEDERLTYPLVALGAGVGLGGAMLVTEEWNVGVGDAWFLAAGMWWPTLSGLFLAQAYGASTDERYAYGLLGATAGLTLTTSVLGFGHVTEGDAALMHSGGAFGTLLGALGELAIRGSTSETPHRGMGFGASGGLLAATALLTQVDPSASRVMFIDLAASLGALTGAAAASPLLLVEEDVDDKSRNRLWIASVGAGTIAGGIIGYFTTRPSSGSAAKAPQGHVLLPSLGVLEIGPRGPSLGATVHGTW